MPTRTQQRTMEHTLAIVLSIGVLLSSLFVIIGSMQYLQKHSADNIIPLQVAHPIHTSLQAFLTRMRAHSPTDLMECGILILIATQILRVALLTVFYGITKELKFFIISAYILLLLLHSFFYPYLAHIAQ